MIKRHFAALTASTLLLGGCDLLQDLLKDEVALRKEAEGKAVGAACRHAGRAIESCYATNAKISKAAIFAGWREMDVYMRENNIQVVLPEQSKDAPAAEEEGQAESKAAETDKAKPEEDTGKKSADAKKATSSGGGATAQGKTTQVST